MKVPKSYTVCTAILIILAFAFMLYAHNDGVKGRTRKSEDKYRRRVFKHVTR